MIQLVLLGLVIAFSFAHFFHSKLKVPGPRGLPIFGYAPFIKGAAHLTFMNLSKIYGPIFKVQLGTKEWLILNSKEAIHEAFVTNKKSTSGRPRNVIMGALSGEKAITFTTDLHFWKEQRMFLTKAMKSYEILNPSSRLKYFVKLHNDFGSRYPFGYDKMEDVIRHEVSFWLRELAKHNGQPCDCQSTVVKAVSNVSCRLIIGRRYDYDEEAFNEILGQATIFSSGNENGRRLAKMLNAANFYRFLPGYRDVFAYCVSAYDRARDEIASYVEEHKNTLDARKPRDLTDRFLVEISKRAGRNDRVFTEAHLPTAMHPVIGASSDTTTNTVRWCIVGLSTNQEQQARIYGEVAAVLETKKYISMEDQFKMPFTRAYLQEIMRFCVPIPLIIPHLSTDDFVLGGYKIPKGTPIIANVWSVHRSEKLFDNPDEFRPERFLDDEGRFIFCEDLLGFSTGPRRCAGEQLARLEVFLFVTYLVSKFVVLPDDDGPKMELGKGMTMVGFAPEWFTAKFVERENSPNTS